jgi:hypothetical protein
MTKKKLYFFVSISCLGGYIWLISRVLYGASHSVVGCLFHKVTGVPCPSCGSTRSVLFLLKGDFIQALHANPFGYILLLLMVVLPVWLLCDFICKKSSFLHLYQRVESVLKGRYVCILAGTFVLINWIWNIYKYM